MNFKYLCQQVDLGRFCCAVELSSGTVARVWKLETDRGLFLVRTLRDREQGEREWGIHRHLHSNGFAAMPAIVVPYLEQSGAWYQVQEYITGSMPDPAAPGMATAMAALAKQLSCAMPEGMIHGDFGPWNLLQRNDGSLAVVDFGETCPGDFCFDYATLFAGVINHTPAERRGEVCGEFLRTLNCDRTRLLEQLHRWAERGIEAWENRSEQMVSRFINARNWAEEHTYEL